MGSFLKSDSDFLDLFVIPIRIILSPIMLVIIYLIQTSSLFLGVTHLDFKSLILLIAIYAMHNVDSIKINRLIFQLRNS